MKFVIQKSFLFILCLTAINLYAVNGHISINNSMTDKDWNFLPTLNNSFDFNKINSAELFIYHNKFGVRYKNSNFKLDLIRPIEPKFVELIANENLLEIFYLKNEYEAFTLSFKDQIADSQKIDCYTLATLTIGFCEDASITITNSDDKYESLDSSLLMIDGSNQELRFNYIKGSSSIFFNEVNVYFAISENSFDWITPLEEIKSGFIYELQYDGQKIGTLIENELKRLPQRDEWMMFKFGSNIKKDVKITNFLDVFYELDLLYIIDDGYIEINNFQNNNIKFDTGLRFNIQNLKISLYGSLYKNNLIGYHDISFNQRSEHHFDKNYGSLSFELKYLF